MAKVAKTIFACQECGTHYSKWQGLCKECNEWNKIIEIKKEEETKNPIIQAMNNAKKNSSRAWVSEETEGFKTLAEVNNDNEKNPQSNRISTGKKELDRVLGGGIMPGSVILIAGSPGAGKSSILIQVSDYVSSPDSPVYYVTGEESTSQVSNRAKRFGITGENIKIKTETDIDKICETIYKEQPKLMIIDSIQVMVKNDSTYALKSSAALSMNTAILTRVAKYNNTALFLVGHVTKDGSAAGPKDIEHTVDVICDIDNDTGSEYRILRSSKNRFGSIDEVGVFRMTEKGMESVDNPSELFMSEDRDGVFGTSVLSTIEGSRPLLIEIQSLVSASNFNYPKRLATGLDLNRLNMLVAIINSHTKIELFEYDVYITAVGGLKIYDPASDLAIFLAIISAKTKKCIPNDIACFGEIDLTGRMRPVSKSEIRIKEAEMRGFKRILVPKKNIPRDKNKFNIEIIGVSDINDVLNNIN